MSYADVIEIPTNDDRSVRELPTLETVSDIVQAQQREGELFLRISNGPAATPCRGLRAGL